MSEHKGQSQKINRDTKFACISVPAHKISGKQEKQVLNTLKREGWGVLDEGNRYRFIRFGGGKATDVGEILSDVDCDAANWNTYQLRFPSVEAAKKTVDSAEWA